MSEARSLPAVHRRRFYVTSHAIDRLRERLADGGAAFRHAPDAAAMGDFLDVRTAEAWDAGRVEHVIDMGRPSRVVNLTAEDVGTLYALLRRNDISTNLQEWAVITVLSASMYERSMRSGGWKRVTEVEAAEVGVRPVSATPLTVVAPPAELPAEPAVQAPVPEEAASWLLTWTDRDGAERSHRTTSREDVRATAARECLNGAVDFRLHVEVPLTVRRHVDVEF